MTVSSTTNKVTYIGNGIAAEFAVPFPFLEQEHLKVYQLLNDIQTERTDWTVSGGNLVFETPPENGAMIVILREVPYTQETDYRENEILSAETLERNFDKLTMAVQQLEEKTGRSVNVGIFDDTNPGAFVTKLNELYSSWKAGEFGGLTEAERALLNAVNEKLDAVLQKPLQHCVFDVFYNFSAVAPPGAFPLWTGEFINGARDKYPEFYNALTEFAAAGYVPVVATNEEYETAVQTFGQCPSFYIDEAAGAVRLPKITRFISSIGQLSDIGAVLNDQIKAHAHEGSCVIVSVSPGRKDRESINIGWPGGATKETGGPETYPKHVRIPLYIQVAARLVRDEMDLRTDTFAAMLVAENVENGGVLEQETPVAAKAENDLNNILGE